MELRPGSDGALVQERVAAQQRPKAAAAPEVAAVRIRADHDAALFFRRTSKRCSAATFSKTKAPSRPVLIFTAASSDYAALLGLLE